MAETYNVIAKVVSQKGTCSANHKVGDEFVIGHETPAGMCLWAFGTMLPFVQLLRYGGSFPWPEGPHRVTVICPDPSKNVCFELSRSEET